MGRATEEKPAAEEELETSVIGNKKVNLDPVRLDTFSSGCDFQVDVVVDTFLSVLVFVIKLYVGLINANQKIKAITHQVLVVIEEEEEEGLEKPLHELG